MSKILYVTTIDLTIRTFLLPHIKQLIKNGHSVDYACNIHDDYKEMLNEIGIKHYDIKFNRNPVSFSNFKILKVVKKLQEENNYDVVHVHTPVAAFFVRLALKDYKVKIIYTCHGFHFYKGAPILNWLVYYPVERLASRWTDKIITINDEDFDRANKFKLRENGQVIFMNGAGIERENYIVKDFDKDIFRMKFGVLKDDFMILLLAEINKNKNHIQIIKALNEIEDNSKIKIICAGEGNQKESLEREVKKLGLEENIKFIGYRTDIGELLNATNCVALLSKREGLGKCILEGLLLEKVVIATDTRGPRTLIKDEKFGILVPVNDYKETAKAIEKVISKEFIEKQSGKLLTNNIDEYLLDNILENIDFYNS